MKKQRSAAEGKANEEWKVKDKKPSKWKGSGYEEQELWINHASPAPYIQTASTDVHVQPCRPIRPFLRPDRIRRGHRQNTKRQYRQIRPIPLIIHSWNFAWSLKLHLILFCRTKKYNYLCTRKKALVAKLVDAPDLGSGVLRRVGSSPIRRTIRNPNCLILSS